MMFILLWLSLALFQKSSCSGSFSVAPNGNTVVQDSSVSSLREVSPGTSSSEGGDEALLKLLNISISTPIASDEPECNDTEGCQISLSTVAGASTGALPKVTWNPVSSIKVNALNVQPNNESTTIASNDLANHQDTSSTSMSLHHQTVPSILDSLHYGGNELDSEVKMAKEYSASITHERPTTPSATVPVEPNSESFGTMSTIISKVSILITNENSTVLPANFLNELIISDITTEFYSPSATSANLSRVSSLQGSEQSDQSTVVFVNDSTKSNADLITPKVPDDVMNVNDSELSTHSMSYGSASSLPTITSSDSETEYGNVTQDLENVIKNYPLVNSSSVPHSEDIENSTSVSIPMDTITELPSRWLTVPTIYSETLPPDIAFNAPSVKEYSTFPSHISTITHAQVPSNVSLSEQYTNRADSTSGLSSLSTSAMDSAAPVDNNSIFILVSPTAAAVGTNSSTDSRSTKHAEANIDGKDVKLTISVETTPNTLSFAESPSTSAHVFVSPRKDSSLKPTGIFEQSSTLQHDPALSTTSQEPPTFTASPGNAFMYKENTILDNENKPTSPRLSTDSSYVSNQDENSVHFVPTEHNFTLPSTTDVSLSTATTLTLNNPVHTKEITQLFSVTAKIKDTATTSRVELNPSDTIPSNFSSTVSSIGGITVASPTKTPVSEVTRSSPYSTSSSQSAWTSTLLQVPTETHREGKHIPFSSPSTRSESTDSSSMGVILITSTDASKIEMVNNISQILNRRMLYEDLAPADKANVITAVIEFTYSHLHKEDLDSKMCKVHNWLLHVLTKEFKNWTKDPFQDSTEEFEPVPFGNLSLYYILPTPDVNSSHMTLTFVIFNAWKNDTLPVDFVLGILNFYSKGLKESVNASSVHFSHGFPSKSYDLLLTILDKYGVMVFTVGLAVVGVLLLMCLVVLYRRRTRHSIHHLTDGKLQYTVNEGAGIDLTPAAVILEDEKGGKENGKKMCDDEGWLVPIHEVPVAEEANVPIVQDTKL